MTDNEKQKKNFALGLDTEVGRHWASLNRAALDDTKIKFDTLITSFLLEFGRQSTSTRQQTLAMMQAPTEPTSAFCIKMRYLLQQHLSSLNEEDKVQIIVDKLQIPAQNFIRARQIPKTFADLTEIVASYEEGFTANPGICNPSTSMAPIKHEVNSLSEDPIQLLIKGMENLSKEINHIKGRQNGRGRSRGPRRGRGNFSQGRGNFSQGRGPPRGNPRGSYSNQGSRRPDVQCHACNKFGHYASECRSSGQNYRGNSRRGQDPGQSYPPQPRRINYHGGQYALVEAPENHHGKASPHPLITLAE